MYSPAGRAGAADEDALDQLWMLPWPQGRGHDGGPARALRLLTALSLALLAGGCRTLPAGDDVAGPDAPDPAPRLVALHIDGVARERRDAVADHLLTPVPERWSWPWSEPPQLDRLLLEEDLARLPKLYRRLGYYETSATHAIEERGPGEVAVRIEVIEGEPVILAHVGLELEGDSPVPDLHDRLREEVELEPGQVFTADAYVRSKQAVEARLAESGHPAAQVRGGARVRIAERAAEVDWTVEPGPHVTLGEIEVDGLEGVNAQVVRDEIGIRPGDPYARSALRQGQRDIFELGLFSRVTLEARRPEVLPAAPTETWPLHVAVAERPPRTLSFGLGYGSEERVRARIGWQHRSLWGSARHFALEARHSFLLSRLEASLEQPRFRGAPVRLRTSLAAERENTPSFEADRVLAGVGLSRPLGRSWKGRLGWKLDLSRIDDVSDASDLELDDPEDSVVLSYLELGLSRSTLDDPVDPRRGHRLGLDSWLATSALGSGSSFARLDLRGAVHRQLGPLGLAARVRVGGMQPFGPTSADEIPLVVRFFAGGSQSVRGYALQKVGPQDASGEALGGTSLAEASLELRFPLWRELRGVVFLDAGVVDLDPWNWPLSETRYGSGVGVRYPTPVGPLRLDVGVPLNRGDDDDSIQIYLGVGHAF